jgi:integrase
MRPTTRSDYISVWKRVPPGLQQRAIAAVEHEDVARLHAAVGGKYKRQAGKLLALLSVLFRDNGRRQDNPTAGIRRYNGDPRQRVLTIDELHRLRAALDHEHEPWRSFFLLAMLTGSRRGALARMQWQDLDLDAGVWRIPAVWSKNRRVLTVALATEAVAILRQRHQERGIALWVFPSNSRAGHLTEPKQAWKRICKRASIQGAVPHDLRRTIGTMVAADAANPAAISAVLGHMSLQSAKNYLHLSAEMARSYVERVAQKTSRAT